jgi:prevent-host-death family protein
MSEATSLPPDGGSVGVRTLKNQLSAYLHRAKAGEEIVITEHGTPIARIVGMTPEADRRQALIDDGVISPAASTTRRLPSRRVRLTAGEPLSELVARQRR